jgi:hypothetical protein
MINQKLSFSCSIFLTSRDKLSIKQNCVSEQCPPTRLHQNSAGVPNGHVIVNSRADFLNSLFLHVKLFVAAGKLALSDMLADAVLARSLALNCPVSAAKMPA